MELAMGNMGCDVFYLPGVKDPERICASSTYLNQELLDKDLARYV